MLHLMFSEMDLDSSCASDAITVSMSSPSLLKVLMFSRSNLTSTPMSLRCLMV